MYCTFTAENWGPEHMAHDSQSLVIQEDKVPCPVELLVDQLWPQPRWARFWDYSPSCPFQGLHLSTLLGGKRLRTAIHSLGLRTWLLHEHSAPHDRRHSHSTVTKSSQRFTRT